MLTKLEAKGTTAYQYDAAGRLKATSKNHIFKEPAFDKLIIFSEND